MGPRNMLSSNTARHVALKSSMTVAPSESRAQCTLKKTCCTCNIKTLTCVTIQRCRVYVTQKRRAPMLHVLARMTSHKYYTSNTTLCT